MLSIICMSPHHLNALPYLKDIGSIAHVSKNIATSAATVFSHWVSNIILISDGQFLVTPADAGSIESLAPCTNDIPIIQENAVAIIFFVVMLFVFLM
ncbi:MAG: hypothetical protein WCP92_08415 [bacterium]